MHLHSRLLAALLMVAGCVADPESDLSDTTSASTFDNGQNLNGQNLNGQNLNGQNLNGQNLNGQNLNGAENGTFTIWTSLDGVRFNGSTVDSTTLASTMFTTVKGANVRAGTDVVGAEFMSMRGDGRSVRVRVRDVIAPSGTATMWRYAVDYLENDGAWYPLCAGDRAAIPLDGIWDHRQGVAGGGAHVDDPTKFTFACEGAGALGKCVAMGYEPWSERSGTNLANHHQACVRLMRGDYCGDGTPYTTDGSRVNVYDALGIQVDTETWTFEAEWDANGARCFSSHNRSKANVPCYNGRLKADCGMPEHFSTGALLMDETPTAGSQL